MQIIHKQVIPVLGKLTTLQLPDDAIVLTSQLQDGRVTVWYRFEAQPHNHAPEYPLRDRLFLVALTGVPIEADDEVVDDLDFIATFQTVGALGPLVLHMFGQVRGKVYRSRN